MALNTQNLKNLADRPEEERKAIASKGGYATAKVRAEKKNLRKALELLLESDIKLKSGGVASGAEAIAGKLFERALNGDIRAFEVIRTTVGQDPVQQIMVAEVDPQVIEEVEMAVLSE